MRARVGSQGCQVSFLHYLERAFRKTPIALRGVEFLARLT
jgi:hypothetical protein